MIKFIKELPSLVYKDKQRNRKIRIGLFKCDCGNEFNTRIVKKLPKSCGCIFKKGLHSTHGKSKESVYNCWLSIKSRCYNINNQDYNNYGGRGISVQEDWVNDFEKFYKYIGDKPNLKFSIERINVNGNYEEGNIKWASSLEQANNRRNNRKLNFLGKNLNISQWEEEIGLSQDIISSRLTRGWSIEKTLLTPNHKNPTEKHKLAIQKAKQKYEK